MAPTTVPCSFAPFLPRSSDSRCVILCRLDALPTSEECALSVTLAFLALPKPSSDLLAALFPAIDRWRAPVHARSTAVRRCDDALPAPAGAPRGAATRPALAAGHRARACDAHSRALPDGRSTPLRCDVLGPAAPLRSVSSLPRQRVVLE